MTTDRIVKRLTFSTCILLTLSLLGACAEPVRQTKPESSRAQTVQKKEPTAEKGREPAATPEPTPESTPTPFPLPTPFSLAWMTDTQEYAGSRAEVFRAMTQWIADTAQERNTILTVHTGDLIRNPYLDYQWENMTQAFSLLPKDMMIVTVAGNHDIAGRSEDYTPYLQYRPDTDVRDENTFAGGYVYYKTFEAGDVPFLVLSVSYGYEIECADWVNAVCAANSDRYAILCVHGYLNCGGLSSGGQYLFPGVVEKSPNIRLVLCGHEHGINFKEDAVDDDGDGTADRVVRQMLFNLQTDEDAGLGYLRMLRFDTEEDTIGVYTYSPFLDREGYFWTGCYPNGDNYGVNYTIENAGLAEYRLHPADLS